MPGQTVAHEPQPVQSSVEMVMANFSPGIRVMSFIFMLFGALATSSAFSTAGRITACGQT